jgi:hypothetical protein
MRTFRLSDADFVALAAGRPSPGTLGELRKAQLSRHLLELRAIGTVPSWYGDARTRSRLADPLTALHTAATRSARRAGLPSPAEQMFSRHRLTAERDGLILRVRLEDTDPLRGRLGLTPAPRLDDAAVGEWQHQLDEAWRLLTDRHRPAAETLAAVLSVIVPVEPDPGAGGISATSAEAYGAVALSAPTDPVSLAVGLLHECQHSVLNAAHFLFDLVRPTGTVGYSPWRDDPRPALGILHGAYAYQAVTRFWRTEAAEAGIAAFEFARWRDAVISAADGLLAGDALTAAGRRFAGALRDEVAPWLAGPVDPAAARLATGANVDHRARWRLRNLSVAPATVSAVVDAWRSGAAPPPLPDPVVGRAPGRALERSDRLTMTHDFLRGFERDQSLQPGGRVRPGTDAWRGEDHGAGPDAYRKIRPGDDAYLRGDHEAAFAAFLQEAVAGDDSAWSGLALVAPYPALRDRPELVRAVWQALDGVDLPKLASWLG